MNYIRFINNGNSVGFCVNEKKYLFDDNLHNYWCIYQSFRQAMNNSSKSDYQDENGYECYIEINGEKASKFDEFFYVSHHFSLEEDSKMGTKSLSLKYVINILQQSEIADDIIQFDSFARVISDNLSSEDIEMEISLLNYKTIAKLISLYFLKDELRAKDYDFDFEETIRQQLKMISSLSNDNKRMIVLIDLLELTEKLKKEIDKLNNCIVIVFVRKTRLNVENEGLYIDGFDLEDEQQIYERMMLMSNYYDLEEYIKKIKEDHLTAYYKK